MDRCTDAALEGTTAGHRTLQGVATAAAVFGRLGTGTFFSEGKLRQAEGQLFAGTWDD
jgi:hypothetical protein